VNINSLKLIHDIFLNNHNNDDADDDNDDDDHHMEKTKAGLKGLYIREITLKNIDYTHQNNYIIILRFPMPWRPDL